MTNEPVNFIQRYNYEEFADFIKGRENQDNWGLEFRKGQPHRTMYGKSCDGSLWSLPQVQQDNLKTSVEVRMVDYWHLPVENVNRKYTLPCFPVARGKDILKKVFETEEDDPDKLSEIARPHTITYPIYDFIYQDFYRWEGEFRKRAVGNCLAIPKNFLALMESQNGKVGLFQSFDYMGDPHTRFTDSLEKMEPYHLPTLVITRRIEK